MTGDAQVASKSTEMLQRNTAVWTSCQRTRKDLCFDVAYLRAVCDLFPVHVKRRSLLRHARNDGRHLAERRS